MMFFVSLGLEQLLQSTAHARTALLFALSA